MNASLRSSTLLASFVSLTVVACSDPVPIDPGFGSGGATVGVGSTNGAIVSTGVTGGPIPPDSSAMFTSGTRLRARILDGGGDARLFEGWFDAELGVDCTSTPIAGQTNRCLPRPFEERVFLDAACASPAVESSVLPPGDPPPYTVEPKSAGQTCDAYVALAVGEEQVVPSVFVEDPSGACVELVGERAVHALSPAALDVFAQLDVVDTSGFPVTVREERGQDGSYRFVSGVLPGKIPCKAMPVEFAGEPRCVPMERVRDAATFTGSSCNIPAIAIDACELSQLRPMTDVQTNACGQRIAVVHQSGKIVDDVFLTGDDAPSCNSVSLGKGRVFGAPTDVFTYPQVWESFGYGPEDLIVSPLALTPPFRLRNLPCDVTETAAGLRCVPPLVPRPTRYLDDQCTTPLTTAVPTECWPPPIMGKYGSDGLLLSVGQIGPAHEGPIYAGGGDQPCTLFAESAPGWFYMVGEYPVDTLPELVRRVE